MISIQKSSIIGKFKSSAEVMALEILLIHKRKMIAVQEQNLVGPHILFLKILNHFGDPNKMFSVCKISPKPMQSDSSETLAIVSFFR